MKLYAQLDTELAAYESRRETIIKESRDILKIAKKSIFLCHDGKIDEASKIVSREYGRLEKLEKEFRKPVVKHAAPFDPYGEGAWAAGVEEFLEAHFLIAVLHKKPFEVPSKMTPPANVIVGALSDVTGELVRQAVIIGSRKDRKALERIRETIGGVINALVPLHLTGGSRQKFDQAKRNLKRIEEIVYDVAIRT